MRALMLYRRGFFAAIVAANAQPLTGEWIFDSIE